MTGFIRLLFALLLAALPVRDPLALAAQRATVSAPDSEYEFPRAVQGTLVEHSYRLKNEGTTPLRIRGVRLSTPIKLARMPAQIAPGQEVAISVRLDTTSLLGEYEGEIEVVLDDADQTVLTFALSGTVVPVIEVSPVAAFFAVGSRGKGGTASVEIINHDPSPLRILGIDAPTERFSLALDTLEDGTRYRVTLTMKPDGPGGRAAETVTVRTSSAVQPTLTIRANTNLRERVYTFPDAVDFGTVSLALLKANPSRFAQTLMIYRLDTTGFEATFTGERGVSITAERGPNGDRVQGTLTLRVDALQPGPITGTVTVRTNDPAFATVKVPFSGTIVP